MTMPESASEKPDWEALRRQFPAAAHFTYLDIARKAILPAWVRRAVEDWLQDVDENAGREAFAMEAVEEARGAVARTFGSPQRNVALIKNTSEGVNIIARGYPMKPGDNVIISEFEHENNTLPWRHLANKGVEVRCVKADATRRITVDGYRHQVDSRTRIVSVAWVAYGTGQRCDIPALADFCHSHGIRLVVDAIQAVGVLSTPIIDLGADAVIAGGHKAQFSLAGAGFMYAADEMIEAVEPPYAAKFSFTDNNRWQADPRLADDAHRFEYGNPNFLGIRVQRQSAEYIERIGLANIEARIRALTDEFMRRAEARGMAIVTPRQWEERAGIVSLDLTGDPGARVESLKRQNIICSAKDGYVRAALHFYNNEEDIDRFFDNIGPK